MSALVELNVSSNQVNVLKPIVKLVKLHQLNLSDNKLTEVSALNALTKIVELDCRFNEINSLDGLEGLSGLIKLFISSNQVENLNALTALRGLKQLYANSNQIEKINPLAELLLLEVLDLRANQIRELEPLHRLEKLTHLHLEANQIKDIHPLKRLRQLNQLNLRHNQIHDIEILLDYTQLTHLYLSDNQLKSLPAWLLNFDLPIKWNGGGQGISVIGNPIESPPTDIIQQGNASIQRYFDALTHQEKHTLNTLKIHFLGDTGVGKTSLIKLLRGDDFDETESETLGLEISHWKHENMKLHCWDFSGKPELFGLHYCFFSARSVYVLVFDNREDRQEQHWLKRIESISQESPVLIVLNKFEQPENQDLDRKALSRRFPNIVGFFPVSSVQGVGIDSFKQALSLAFKRVGHLKMTKRDLQVKKHLDKKLFLSDEQYVDLCQQQGLNQKNEQQELLSLLNDLGDMVSMKDADNEQSYLFNPEWITQAMYKILTSAMLAKQQAQLSLDDLEVILKVKTAADAPYPNDNIPCIIEFFKQLGLCLQLENQRLLFPQLLADAPEEIEFDDKDALSFQLQYNYLNEILFPRLLLKVYNQIDKKNCYRQHIILKNSDFNSRASIRVNYQKNAVYIKTNGEKKRDYYAALRDTLKTLLS